MPFPPPRSDATMNGHDERRHWANGQGGRSSRDSSPHRRRDSSPESSSSSLDRTASTGGHVHPLDSVNSFPELVPMLPFWSAKRHLTGGNVTPIPPEMRVTPSWRLRDKLKTSNAALVLCLNLDVDPPDVVKTQPCAHLECWVDPHSLPSSKALETIGNNLHHQFESLNPRMKYKPYLDPSFEETRKFCTGLRKMAKEERALFYYNGHGVPKPTPSGELWVFNRNYSQYIPVSLYDLQSWLGSPCVYVWDCSAAGNLLNNFVKFARRRDEETNLLHGGYPDGMLPFMESIQLAACAADETLPMAPELPADVFTSCLTSPIDIALRYFILQNQLPTNVTFEMAIEIPGDLKDRRTPLGELNWIFTAVTDTIAWTSFPRDIFRRLFRQDLLVAALFRNFLLAERIMRNYHCTPQTYPPLPPTNTHPMWASWDLAVEACLSQLPDLLASNKAAAAAQAAANAAGVPYVPGPPQYTYVPSKFFTEHLTAFDVWLSRGGSALTKRGPRSLPPMSTMDSSDDGSSPSQEVNDEGSEQSGNPKPPTLVPRKPPDQLPILLQVLLSQAHRLPALILLCQFVDLGPWAVNLALAIGIFPYVQKLLQSPANDLKPVLIFIWTRILAVDPSCQADLLKDHGYLYFVNILATIDTPQFTMISNASEHRAMCAFILSVLSRDYHQGQMQCLKSHVFENCLMRLDEDDFLLKQWACLCIAQIWDNNEEGKMFGFAHGTQDRLCDLLKNDLSAEVRAAALYALSTFMGASGSAKEENRGGGGSGGMPDIDELEHLKLEVNISMIASVDGKDDASPMVRKELVVLLSCLVKEWRGHFVVAAWVYWEEDRRWKAGRASGGREPEEVIKRSMVEWFDRLPNDQNLRTQNQELLSSFFTILCTLFELSVDPYPEVAALARTVVDYIMALLLESPFSKLPATSLRTPITPSVAVPAPPAVPRSRHISLQSIHLPSFTPSAPPSPTSSVRRAPLTRSDTMSSTASRATATVTNTLKRTSSFAASTIKNLTGGYAFPSSSDDGGRSSSPTPSSYGNQLPLRSESDWQSHPPSPQLNVATYISPYSPPPTPEPEQNMSPRSLGRSSTPSSPTSRPRSPFPESTEPDKEEVPSFTAADVIEALLFEDMERLRSRRQLSVARRSRRHPMDAMHSPSSNSFISDVTLGLGTGGAVRDVLPLKSKFYDWGCEYFMEPQMRQAEKDEPGSVAYNHLLWRRQRNEKIVSDTQSQAEIAPYCHWDRPITSFRTSGYPLKLAFHQFDTHVAVSDETSMISIWDWSRRKRLCYFTNGNPSGTTITSLHFMNDDSGGILAAGSAEGVVRMYRNYDPATSDGPLSLVTAFRALSPMVSMKRGRGSGLVSDWVQATGHLIVGGDSKDIQIWDAHRETCPYRVGANTGSSTTSITADHDSPSVFVAGFANGIISVFDRRMRPQDVIVRTYKDHEAWIQKVHRQRSGRKELLSASMDGQIRLWDVRASGANGCVGEWIPHIGGLSAFDVHEQTGVFAATSSITSVSFRTQHVSVQSIPPTQPTALLRVNIHHPPTSISTVLSRFSITTGLSQAPVRTAPSMYLPNSSSLAFHPLEMMYAVGSPDGTVKLFGCKLSERNIHSDRDTPEPMPDDEGKMQQIPAYLEGLSGLPSIRSAST